MNGRTFGILLGFFVIGIAMTGGAAADTNAPVTQSSVTGPITDTSSASLQATPFLKCCCCDFALGTASDLNIDTRAVETNPRDHCCCCRNWAVGVSSDLRMDAKSAPIPT
mgnify:CR=1 FL=1